MTFFKPITQKEHTVEACDYPMACHICMGRCYEDYPGHIFKNGEDSPCDCGKYTSLTEAQKNFTCFSGEL